MGTSSSPVRLRGSFRRRPAVRWLGDAPPQELIQISVVVRVPDDDLVSQVARMGQLPPRARSPVNRHQFRTQFAARPEDLEKVRLFARNHGLRVLHVYPDRRVVELSGTVRAMTAAFGVQLGCYKAADGIFRGRAGWIHVPSWLADSLEGVFGLDTRLQAVPHVRIGRSRPRGRSLSAPAGSITAVDVAKLYNFPTAGRGSGQCIGLIEFGGGYRLAEVKEYFSHLGIRPTPRIVEVSVDGATNTPRGNVARQDCQVAVDIEVAGAVAPEATLVVYFAPNTSRGVVDAVKTAVHDTTHRPSVVSIGWGRAETAWTAQACAAIDSTLREAAALGIPVVVASGSNGSAAATRRDLAVVDFPASSPYALACGGTVANLHAGTAPEEVVWNGQDGASGGGVSQVFPVPPYQSRIGPTSVNAGQGAGRGVPDVSGHADPTTGYWSLVDGQSVVVGGTGAVAPLYAGLAALLQEQLRAGLAPIHPVLYRRSGSRAVRDVVRGDNGAYVASPGWDPCTGLGSVDGVALLAALSGTTPSPPPSDGNGRNIRRERSRDVRVVLTLLARDEVDVIETMVDYHLAQGVDAIIATDNRSRDGTRQILERYARSGRLHLLREEGNNYRQAEWVTRMARLACTELAADWVINADADEFWWPSTGDLRSTLRRVPPEYVTVLARRRNFVPIEPVGELPFFARMTLVDPDPRTSHGAPLIPKVCHRGRPDITVVRGNHEVLGEDVGLPFDEEILTVLHFPIRSYEQLEHKVVVGANALGRRALAAGVAASLGHLYEAHEEGRLRDYYDANVVYAHGSGPAVAAGTIVVDRRLVSFLKSAGVWTPTPRTAAPAS
jgi:kumamolisin